MTPVCGCGSTMCQRVAGDWFFLQCEKCGKATDCSMDRSTREQFSFEELRDLKFKYMDSDEVLRIVKELDRFMRHSFNLETALRRRGINPQRAASDGDDL